MMFVLQPPAVVLQLLRCWSFSVSSAEWISELVNIAVLMKRCNPIATNWNFAYNSKVQSLRYVICLLFDNASKWLLQFRINCMVYFNASISFERLVCQQCFYALYFTFTRDKITVYVWPALCRIWCNYVWGKWRSNLLFVFCYDSVMVKTISTVIRKANSFTSCMKNKILCLSKAFPIQNTNYKWSCNMLNWNRLKCVRTDDTF